MLKIATCNDNSDERLERALETSARGINRKARRHEGESENGSAALALRSPGMRVASRDLLLTFVSSCLPVFFALDEQVGVERWRGASAAEHFGEEAAGV